MTWGGGHLLEDLPFPEQRKRLSRSLHNDFQAGREEDSVQPSTTLASSVSDQEEQFPEQGSSPAELNYVAKCRVPSEMLVCTLCPWDLSLLGYIQRKIPGWMSLGGSMLRVL